MSFTKLYVSGPFDVTGSDAFTIYGKESDNVDPGAAEVLRRSSGLVDPSFVATLRREQQISMTIEQLETIFTAGRLNNSGMAIPDQGTGLVHVDGSLYFGQLDDLGDRVPGSFNTQVLVNRGLLLPSSLSVQKGEIAQLELMLHPTTDGINNPYVINPDVALPAVGFINEIFTLGRFWIGTQEYCPDNITINWGIEPAIKFCGGSVHPQFAAIMVREMKVNVEFEEGLLFDQYGDDPHTSVGDDVTFYLHRAEKLGELEADNSTNHIRVKLFDGQWMARTEGYGGDAASTKSGSLVFSAIAGVTDATGLEILTNQDIVVPI